MNNKTIIALLIILIAAISFLAVQNFKLNKKVEELSTVKVEVKAVPETSETKPANPQEASPLTNQTLTQWRINSIKIKGTDFYSI